MADVDDLFNLFEAENDNEDAGNVPIVVEETDKSSKRKEDQPELIKEYVLVLSNYFGIP